MKIRNNKGSGAVGSKSRLKGQLTITPAVIVLPDGTAEAAKAVMTASETPPGPIEPVSNSESNDLHEAATNPAKALGGQPDIRTVPLENVEEASFEELSDAELAAAKLLEELDAEGGSEIKAHPIDVLFSNEPTPPESKFANSAYELISGGGQKFLILLNNAVNNANKFFTQLKLRAIAFGNSVVDFVKKTGNDAWKLHDELKKNPAAPYIWLVEQKTKVNATAWATYDKFRAFLAERSSGGTAAAIRDLTQVILDLKETHEVELRRTSKRINSLERQLDKNTRASLRLSNMSNPIDAEQLKTLMTAVSQKRKVDAVNLTRAITGGTLASAKAIVEEATVSLN